MDSFRLKSFVLMVVALVLGAFLLNGCSLLTPFLSSLESEADFEIFEEDDGAPEEIEFFEEDTKNVGATLRGKVRDSKTRAPIEGVTVALVGTEFTVVTNDDGFYQFTSVPAGKYTLRAEKDGYKARQKVISLKENKIATLNFTMQSKNATLKGTVKEKTTGRVLSDVEITIEGPPLLSTKTDRQGRYAFSNVPPGTYTLRATRESYVDFQKKIALQPTRTTTLNIRMQRQGGTPGKAKWTVMVYMAADNSLSSYAQYDLAEMKAVGSNENLNIVAFLDRRGQTGYYSILPNQELLVKSLGSLDSGNGNTLRNFIQFVKENYPADRYALILWNHGDGWRNPGKGICFDDSSKSGITMPELASALQEGGIYFDLIGMDACLMAMVEVAYEIRNYGRVLVASQGFEPGNGWNYTTFLKRLKYSPTMSVQSLAEEIVNGYFSSYSSGAPLTLSVIDLSRVGNLVQALDDFATIVRSDSYSQTLRLISPNLPYVDTELDYADIYNFAQALLNTCTTQGCSPSLVQSLQSIQQELTNTVIKNRTSGYYQGARGLSIYLPYSRSIESPYSNLAFAQDTAWDDFLAWWCSE